VDGFGRELAEMRVAMAMLSVSKSKIAMTLPECQFE
jgi:hypothetical protein